MTTEILSDTLLVRGDKSAGGRKPLHYSRWYKLKPNTMAPSQGGIRGNLILLFPGPATNSGQVFLSS